MSFKITVNGRGYRKHFQCMFPAQYEYWRWFRYDDYDHLVMHTDDDAKALAAEIFTAQNDYAFICHLANKLEET